MELNLKKNNNVDIFIYSHKPFFPIVSNHIYKVLTNSHAESKEFNTDLEIFRDYNGDNISDKNLMYNEYCGFYWIWKNYPLKDYVGMNHYSKMYACLDKVPDVNEIFEEKKIILNEPVKFNNSLWQKLPKMATVNNVTWYEYWHNIDDLKLLEDIIVELFPEYVDGFKKMCKANYLYNSSMFIMKKNDFKNYCEFIFTVLKEICKRRNYNSTDDCIKWVEEHKDKYIKEGLSYYTVEMQARIVGYLAERAMNAYIMHGGNNSLENNALIMPWVNIKR